MYQTVSAWSDVTRMIIFFILVSLFLTIAYYIILIQGKFFIAMQSIFFTLRTWTVWNDEMMRQCSWTRSSATSLARVNIFICSIIPSLRRRVIGYGWNLLGRPLPREGRRLPPSLWPLDWLAVWSCPLPRAGPGGLPRRRRAVLATPLLGLPVICK